MTNPEKPLARRAFTISDVIQDLRIHAEVYKLRGDAQTIQLHADLGRAMRYSAACIFECANTLSTIERQKNIHE